jgi:anti-anti-sigma factor
MNFPFMIRALIRFLFADISFVRASSRGASRFPGAQIMLSVTVEDLGEVVILRCLGRIVRGTETAILCAAVRQQGRDIILDLRRVDAIDAAGIGVLISLQAAGIYLKLMDPSEHVREVLRFTGLESVFEIHEAATTNDVLGECIAGAGS